MKLERFYFRRKEDRNLLTLTKEQFIQIASFFPDQEEPTDNNRLGAFNGFLNDDEKKELWNRLTGFSAAEILLQSKRGDYLPSVLEELGISSALAKKIRSHWQLEFLTEKDIEKIKNFFTGIQTGDKVRRDFSLPVTLLLLSLSDEERTKLVNFLENGGVLSLLSAKRPTKEFIKVVENLPFSTIQDKIAYVFSDKGRPNEKINSVSHKFMNVILVSEDDFGQGNLFKLQREIAESLDKIESDFARIVFLKTLIGINMGEVKTALASSAVLASLFYLIDQIAVQKTNNENIYFLFHSLVKIITHAWANLVDFYAQYKLLINGDNLFFELKDLVKKISWKGGLIFLQGMILDVLSEIFGHNDSILGSVIFGFEPMAGTSMTTVLATNQFKRSFDDDDEQNLSFIMRLRKLLENPAVLGMNAGVFLTFLTSIGLLGLAGQFHNPVAVVGVGALSEPLYASLIITLIQRRRARKEEERLIEQLVKD